MLEILIWAVAAVLVALGAISFQMGQGSPQEEGNTSLIGLVTLAGSIAGAAFLVYQANQQASSFSALPSF